MHTYLTLLFLSLLSFAPSVKVESAKFTSPTGSETSIVADATGQEDCLDAECSDRGSGRRTSGADNKEPQVTKERGSGRGEADAPLPKKQILS